MESNCQDDQRDGKEVKNLFSALEYSSDKTYVDGITRGIYDTS